jgi:adenine-specific DNA-methyltransferase
MIMMSCLIYFIKYWLVNIADRKEDLKAKYNKVPYLNSSLFEISELEDYTIKINALNNKGQLEFIGTTILKDLKKTADKLPTLQYLFEFFRCLRFC